VVALGIYAGGGDEAGRDRGQARDESDEGAHVGCLLARSGLREATAASIQPTANNARS
jgi:hypothetical protein